MPKRSDTELDGLSCDSLSCEEGFTTDSEMYGNFLANKIREEEEKCQEKDKELKEYYIKIYFLSAEVGDFELYKESRSFLSQHIEDINSYTDNNGKTALYYALLQKNIEFIPSYTDIINYLIENDVKITADIINEIPKKNFRKSRLVTLLEDNYNKIDQKTDSLKKMLPQFEKQIAINKPMVVKKIINRTENFYANARDSLPEKSDLKQLINQLLALDKGNKAARAEFFDSIARDYAYLPNPTRSQVNEMVLLATFAPDEQCYLSIIDGYLDNLVLERYRLHNAYHVMGLARIMQAGVRKNKLFNMAEYSKTCLDALFALLEREPAIAQHNEKYRSNVTAFADMIAVYENYNSTTKSKLDSYSLTRMRKNATAYQQAYDRRYDLKDNKTALAIIDQAIT
ncbi:MAG: hypothetical protein ACK4PR_08515, partial [Gammaproteobacteria bacterium]